jgi:hypothetical protein
MLAEAPGLEASAIHPASGIGTAIGLLVRRGRHPAAAAVEPRWLVEGLWPADACGMLAGDVKAGKT